MDSLFFFLTIPSKVSSRSNEILIVRYFISPSLHNVNSIKFSAVSFDIVVPDIRLHGSLLAELRMAAGGSDSLFINPSRSTNPNDIGFLLFHDPRMKHVSTKLIYDDIGSLTSSPFSISKATKVLIHGLFLDTCDDFPSLVKNAYLDNQDGKDQNIIIVNWSRLADQKPDLYLNVLQRVITVSTRVADFLLWLHTSVRLDLGKDVHLVGHWFGAHLAGMVGTNLIAKGHRLARITALDPRDPGYWTDVYSRRLQKYDATFVDVYHTNESTMEASNMLGHVDFFVNRSTATPMLAPDTTKWQDKNSIAHRMFAQSIKDGPSGNNVTSQIGGFNSDALFVYPASIIMGEYCMAGTNGWFDAVY